MQEKSWSNIFWVKFSVDYRLILNNILTQWMPNMYQNITIYSAMERNTSFKNINYTFFAGLIIISITQSHMGKWCQDTVNYIQDHFNNFVERKDE